MVREPVEWVCSSDIKNQMSNGAPPKPKSYSSMGTISQLN